MSVQAGIWNFDGKPADPQLVAEFSEQLKQQGPDGEFSLVDGPIALLYRPFHTTAESRREKQPHLSHRGFALTWDGRLDNRDDLTVELKGDIEGEPSDVAIVAAAFDRWDTECFRRIIGDWALSIWKPQQQELMLAVDYMAIRHIFYYLKKARVWWATDLAPLVLLSRDKFHIDDGFIAGYFAHDPDAHLTPYSEIREVPAGQFVRIRNGVASVARHWRFSPKARIGYKTDAEYEEHFRHVFRQSVRRRLRADSPILAELSGGLDSSSIVCMADEILANEGVHLPRVDTISYYDKTEPDGDDWVYFPKVEASRGKTGHHIDASALGGSYLSVTQPHFMPLPGHLGSGLDVQRSATVRQGGYRVVLSGIGGDEFMGGVPDPSDQLADLIVQLKFIRLGRQLMAWGLAKKRPCLHLLLRAIVKLLPTQVARYVAKEAKPEPWIDKDFARKAKLASLLLDGGEHQYASLPTQRACLGGIVLMSNKLAKVVAPRLVMEETRYPYLDYDLIDFVFSIPPDQMLRPTERRSLMRRSLVDVVPQEVLSRHTKQLGARGPVIALERHWATVQAAFEVAISSKLGFVASDQFMEDLQAARSGKSIHIVRMLRTISLELWLQDLASRNLIHGQQLPTLGLSPISIGWKRSRGKSFG